ncbi:AAA family ATPase [Chitinibacter sp. FCG-7]|uniref:AAA family ATPase n=1 Tax=Chitinibacter mangrovi TaxID=3153927 RepID=A0AAU7F768_9NEIS
MSEQPSKQLVVVGGPNGSGKSTFADEYVALYQLRYLGADAIAAELAPNDPFSVRVEAGKQFVRRLKAALQAGESLVIESTLAGKGLDKHLLQAKTFGYQISLVFVTLDSPDLSIARIRERVANGGHHVPDEDVIRRFDRARNQFWHTFRHLADDWQLFSNTGEGFTLIALGQSDDYEVTDITELNEFTASLEQTHEH